MNAPLLSFCPLRFRVAARLLTATLIALAFAVSLPAQDLDAVRDLYFKGEYADALSTVRKGRNTVDALLWQSIILEEQGDRERAERVIKRSQGWDRFPPLVNRIGEIALARAQYEKAEVLFEQALALKSGYMPAQFNLFSLQLQNGDVAAREKLNKAFIEEYKKTPYPDATLSWLTAKACVLLDRFEDANDLFQSATKLRPQDWRPFVDWGHLFVLKYNYADALATFQDALKRNPHAITAHLGVARAAEEENMQVAMATLDKLLTDHPEHEAVKLYAARMRLLTGDYEKAGEHLKQLLSKKPDYLEALALKGQLELVQKDNAAYRRTAAKVMRVNPAYAAFYEQAGQALMRIYLFEEAIAEFQKALRIDARNAQALAGMGTAQSRLAKQEEAYATLERAFDIDPYNLWTGNLLKLFDSYTDYDTLQTKHTLIRLHKSDTPVVGPYAKQLLEEAYADMLPRYGFDLDFPVTVEIFPKHDDFAVRCFGLPGAQVFLGICFGPLITMNSPRARQRGSFNWGETLWHEFAHVVHLTLTRNRVPRWLAEGIAVYEATRARPAWDMNLDLMLVKALQEDELIPLAELNAGFTGDPQRVTFSYYEASKMVEFIVHRDGMDALKKLLHAFRDDADTPEAIRRVMGLSQGKFDKEFKAYLSERYIPKDVSFNFDPDKLPKDPAAQKKHLEGVLKKSPGDFFALIKLASLHMEADDLSAAEQHLKKAISLFPAYVGAHDPYSKLAAVYRKQKREQDELTILDALVSRDGKAWDAALRLAELARKRGKPDIAARALETAIYIYPYEPRLHSELGEILLSQNQPAQAVREFEIELALKPTDLAGAHCRLAQALLDSDKPSQARRHALKALEIAPTYDQAQNILLQAVR